MRNPQTTHHIRPARQPRSTDRIASLDSSSKHPALAAARRAVTVGLGFALALLLAPVPAFAAPDSKADPNGNNKAPAAHHPLQVKGGQGDPRHVDLVIALDTSSSMDGLIDGARQKLWDVVSLLAQARPQPVLRVGVISYGNTGYDPKAGWVRKEIDLTTDLDSVYSRLFGLRTGGGTEYVARALRDATETMQWDRSAGTLRMVFVAGNEAADQDPTIPVGDAVARARDRGIFVNTIYCGSQGALEANLWKQVATLGRGEYAAIDHNRSVVIATPMDAELARLSGELSRTYVSYGGDGRARAANQVAQDANAASLGTHAAAARAVAKSSALYSNAEWDLVDAKNKGKSVAAVPVEELPENLRAMKPAEREAWVAARAKERAALQKQIAEVSARRDQYIQEQRKKDTAKRPAALDDALGGAVKREAEAAGFVF